MLGDEMTASLAQHPVHGPAFTAGRLETGELRSPCADFKVLALRIYGRDVFEAYRMAGQGWLYSLTTTDLAELHDALREACGSDSGGGTSSAPGGISG